VQIYEIRRCKKRLGYTTNEQSNVKNTYLCQIADFMLEVLLLVSGAIGISLVISGFIVLLVPSKKPNRKNDVPQTLSQALGINFDSLPTATSAPATPPAHVVLRTVAVTPSAVPDTSVAPAPTVTSSPAITQSILVTQISPERIQQFVTNHERLITLINGVQKMNNARKNEQIIKIAKDLLQTSYGFTSEQSWLAIKPYVEAIYPNFFKKLNDAASEELSDFEVRVCLLSVFNLSSKEIAQITNRSIRTIETTVYKIRKKLKIPTDERVADHLQNL
jgi:DNA-binding CsgD family transcriptional regulator